jgi:putative restriction endonuclease
MAGYPTATLRRILAKSLPNYVGVDSEHSPKPAVFEGGALGSLKIYLWTVTPDKSASGRPAGEHKSQIILPNTAKGDRQIFELTPSTPVYLLGWSPAFSVFVLWEIERHQGAAYSKNIQVREELLQIASEQGWAVAEPRRLKGGPLEVRCAVHPAHLERLLVASREADERELEGQARQVFLESSAPEFNITDSKTDPSALDEVLQWRRMVNQQRLERSSRFAAQVLPLYDYSCAICKIQLNAVEAAHIIPVHDPRSEDEPWNGIALCRNHHKLFDSRIVLVDRDAFVRTDKPTLDLLHNTGRAGGLGSLVTPYAGKRIAVVPPQFETDTVFRNLMQGAFDLNQLL